MNNDTVNSPCIILEVGAEGGSIKLYGKEVQNGWRFMCALRDQTESMFDEGREIRR